MFNACACRATGGRGRGRSSLCAQHAGLGERAFQKIILQRQLPDLGVQRLQIHWRRARLALLLTENARRSFEKLGFPLRDLIGVNVELLRQFGQRLLALQSRKGHFRLEGRCVVPACALRHRNS